MRTNPLNLLLVGSLLSLLLSGCGTTEEAIQPPPSSASSGTAAPASHLKATLLSARLAPIKTADGKPTVEVLAEWKNTGDAPIRVVKADITAYDAEGTPVGGTPANNYTIAALSARQAVAPGKTYKDPSGEGFMIVPMPGEKKATRVKVEITDVAAKTALDE